jgi:CheY-like chemotaxis protein
LLLIYRAVDYHRLQSAHSSQARPTVLVVDDHVDLRDSIAVLLEIEGYAVVDAGNGREALRYLSSSSSANVAAIVLDLAMPVMDGWEFLAERRANPTLSEIPTIVVTGVSDARRRHKELAELAVFTKPFHFEELIGELRRVLEASGPHKPTAAGF